MPKYLVKVPVRRRAKGLLKDGGSKRRAVVETMSKGRRACPSPLLPFGDTDATRSSSPDCLCRGGITAVNASGAVSLKLTHC